MLEEFLTRYPAVTCEDVDWGSLPLTVASYITGDLPPLEYVTSVRAIVFGGDALLVFHDGVNAHILPGGRREPGESVEETLAREVLEETGYSLQSIMRLGFLHFHHLGPEPGGYSYPYPDFLQIVFSARAGEYRPEDMVKDQYVKRSEMMLVENVLTLPLPACELALLRAALAP